MPFQRPRPSVRGNACLVGACAAALVLAMPALAGSAAGPTPALVVAELFTSEGCSSCPPADALLAQLASTQPVGGARIIALGEHVDYWDQQGWRDPFSSPAFTRRQQEYGRIFGPDRIYTPQLVVNGRTELVGNDAGAARRALANGAREHLVPIELTIGPPDVAVAPALLVHLRVPELATGAHAAQLLLAVTEDGLASDVQRGENQGRHLAHAAVVRQMHVVTSYRPGVALDDEVRMPIEASWTRSNLHVVAILQDERTRRIVGAGLADLH